MDPDFLIAGQTAVPAQTEPDATTCGPASGSIDLDDRSDRRNVLKRAAGLAAVGVVGGSALSTALATVARASTTQEQGALAPTVVVLTDAPTISVDASLGNDFRVTINGPRTMSNPLNPSNGQQILFQVTQGSSAPFNLAWGNAYDFSTGLPQPTLSTGAGQTDLLGFMYNATSGNWLLVAFVNGFGS